MLALIRTRLLLAIPTLLAVTFVTFFLGYLSPGSPIDIMLGQHSDAQTRKQLEHAYGLDRPPLVQYGSYLWGLLHGNLGKSFANINVPVTQLIANHFPTTAFLAFMALLLAMLVGLPAGALAALKHNKLLDRLTMSVVLMLVSVPAFVLGPVLMLILALRLNWLPAAGWEGPENWVMPILVLAARPAALLARFMRSSMLDVLRQDYIRTAFAKGLSPGRVLLKHALKNAFLPVLTVLGTTFGFLLTGSFVVETIFTVPGIGYESIQSILRRDYPVIQGVALLVAVIFITVNLVVDILYGLIDPRVRFEEAR
jgi:ABC-type dipeptide/oligopeptide/nickel transport system permease component